MTNSAEIPAEWAQLARKAAMFEELCDSLADLHRVTAKYIDGDGEHSQLCRATRQADTTLTRARRV